MTVAHIWIIGAVISYLVLAFYVRKERTSLRDTLLSLFMCVFFALAWPFVLISLIHALLWNVALWLRGRKRHRRWA